MGEIHNLFVLDLGLLGTKNIQISASVEKSELLCSCILSEKEKDLMLNLSNFLHYKLRYLKI